MSKFNTRASSSVTPAPRSPMTTTGTATTHEGGAGFTRDAKSELFLTAVTNMVGEDTFYESASERDNRYAVLVRQVTLEDPGWMWRFIGWLRNSAHMRSASVVAAAEAVLARREAGVSGNFDLPGRPGEGATRSFIPQAMARADEPGEFLAYWTGKWGKKLPSSVKRGLADAVVGLFDEYAYAKYGRKEGFQLADIVDLVHPGHKAPWQADLWVHALNERHKRDAAIPASLTMLHSRKDLMEIPQDARRAFMANDMAADCFKRAGMTWEQLSGWLGGELDASFWESLIPTMGYMALLRNLRNFEKAGISRAARKAVQERLADPEQVVRSRQFPYRFLSAYRAVESDWWAEALSDALDASVGSLPRFPGKTLVLVDTSGSMLGHVSEKSSVRHVDIGALFGVALARGGNDVELVGYADRTFVHELPKGGSVLRGIDSLVGRIGQVGYGTQTVQAIRQHHWGHDRVVVVTDGQAFPSWQGSVSAAVPAGVRLYGIGPVSYRATSLDLSTPNRYEIAGFSDQVFRMIGLIEAGSADWPF